MPRSPQRRRIVGIDQRFVLFTEISAPSHGIGENRSRIALAILRAEIQHHDAVGDVHDHAHVVLDHLKRSCELFIEINDVSGIPPFLEVMPAIGSSSRISRGSSAIARASSTRLRRP